MRSFILVIVSSILFISSTKSQDCQVSVDSLKGNYFGGCRKGKADGKGTASGADSYTGNFKNGFPEGEGKYNWKNGSWYEGSWHAGKFDGKGTYYKVTGEQDSSVSITGFWKNGKYVGKYEKPYTINSQTNNISDVSVRKINSTESEITITVRTITGGASSLSSNHIPKSRLANIQAIEGRYEQFVADEASSPMVNKYILRKITFPFYAILSFEPADSKLPAEKLALELFENCDWAVQVRIDN